MGADIYYLRPGQTELEERQITGWRTDESVGYFRDTYNQASTLLLFELSWWQDIAAFLNDAGEITSDRAKTLLEVLDERKPVFETNVAKLSPDEQAFQRRELAVFTGLLDKVRRTKGARLYCWI